MAVLDKYVNANQEAGKLANPALMQGMTEFSLIAETEIAVADSDTSVYRIANLPSNAIITSISSIADTITSGTDYDLGIYDANSGDVVDADFFADAINFSSGFAVGSESNNMTNVAIDEFSDKLYIHAGATVINKKEGYDLAWTANTVGSSVGTIVTIVKYILG